MAAEKFCGKNRYHMKRYTILFDLTTSYIFHNWWILGESVRVRITLSLNDHHHYHTIIADRTVTTFIFIMNIIMFFKTTYAGCL